MNGAAIQMFFFKFNITHIVRILMMYVYFRDDIELVEARVYMMVIKQGEPIVCRCVQNRLNNSTNVHEV